MPASAPDTRLLIVILAIITALGPMTMQIFLPALPAIQDSFLVSAGTAQLVLSVALAAIAVATLAYGPASDRHGRRPVLLVGLLIFLAGSVLCVLAPNIWVLIAGRIAQAVGAAAGMVLSRAIIRDLYDRETAARLMAYMVTALVAAPMVAPIIGGVLNDWLGWRSIFVFTAISGLLVILLAFPRVPETLAEPVSSGGARGMLGGFVALLRVPAYLAYVGQIAFGMGMFMTFLGAAPYVTIRVLERPPTEFGLFFALVSSGFMMGTFATARLSGRINVERMVLIGSSLAVLFSVLMLALTLAGYWTTWAIFLPGMGMAFANGLAMPNAQAAALSINPRIAGTASGLLSFIQMAVGALFAQLAGTIHDGTPMPMGAITLIAAVLAFLCVTILPRFGAARPA